MNHILTGSGATLLVFANKQDLPGALTFEEIKQVLYSVLYINIMLNTGDCGSGSAFLLR